VPGLLLAASIPRATAQDEGLADRNARARRHWSDKKQQNIRCLPPSVSFYAILRLVAGWPVGMLAREQQAGHDPIAISQGAEAMRL